MVEMSVRQHDRGRLSVFTEALGGQPADTRARTNARNTRIDQHPAGSPWRPEVSHIDDCMALIRQIGGNFDRAVLRLMPCAIARGEWYLLFHRVWASLVQRLLCDAITHHPDYVPSTCCKSVTKGRAALRLPQHVPVHSVMRERGEIGCRVVLIPQNILPLRIQ